MANQIKKTQDIIRENWEMLKDIKKKNLITEEQQKKLAEVMSDAEVAEYVSQKKKKTQDTIKQTRDGRKQTEWFQETIKTRKEDIALIKKVAEKMDVSFEEAYNMLHGGDELKKKVSSKKESKEKMKTPQLETKNHKIDEWKSKKEKLAEWWKEEERPVYIDGSETKIKVLKKELAPGAFVREYQDDGKMPKHLVGEQLFNWKAVLSLGLQDRLPSYEQMETMRWWKENHGKFLENNFQKDWKNLFPGFWIPDDKGFDGVGERTDCWLSDGRDVDLDRDDVNHDDGNPEFGFSLRLLKN